MDAAFAADLSTIQEDIISPDKRKDDDDVIHHPYSTESNVLKSQPLNNLFIETNCKTLRLLNFDVHVYSSLLATTSFKLKCFVSGFSSSFFFQKSTFLYHLCDTKFSH